MSKEYIEAFRDILGILSAVSGCEVDMNSERIITVRSALQRLEQIDNANPSEALECVEEWKYQINSYIDCSLDCGDIDNECYNRLIEELEQYYTTIKQALLKAQEPKHYLKWEDLKKFNSEELLKVKLNNVKYELHFEKWAKYDDATRISLYLNEFCVMSIRLRTDYDKQFFNDLHLERVEE